MRILKIIGLILLVIIGLVVALGLVAPNRVITQQSILINAPQAAAFRAVNDLTQWPHWSPWNQRDNTMKLQYGEKTEGAGAYYTWTSENSGSGQMNIKETYATDSLHTWVEFDGQGNTLAKFFFDPQNSGQTKVTWSFDSKFPFPFNAMLLFQDIKSFIDKDYAEGLAYLKAHVENNFVEASDFTIREMDFATTYYLAQRQEVAMADVQAYFTSAMPAVVSTFTGAGVEMEGVPTGLYYKWDEENQKTDMAIGVPAISGTQIEGLVALEIPASRALQIDYFGNYSGTAAAHEAIDAYIADNGFTFKAPAIERYITDPNVEPDTSKWLTEVVYLVD